MDTKKASVFSSFSTALLVSLPSHVGPLGFAVDLRLPSLPPLIATYWTLIWTSILSLSMSSSSYSPKSLPQAFVVGIHQ